MMDWSEKKVFKLFSKSGISIFLEIIFSITFSSLYSSIKELYLTLLILLKYDFRRNYGRILFRRMCQ